mmetsp:Transcript_17200/g.42694  ORF Transcript_17200/g.42694 Transcript_17200/m.42694 type:complete len:588 (+) Transcript_17200:279-2042(+)
MVTTHRLLRKTGQWPVALCLIVFLLPDVWRETLRKVVRPISSTVDNYLGISSLLSLQDSFNKTKKTGRRRRIKSSKRREQPDDETRPDNGGTSGDAEPTRHTTSSSSKTKSSSSMPSSKEGNSHSKDPEIVAGDPTSSSSSKRTRIHSAAVSRKSRNIEDERLSSSARDTTKTAEQAPPRAVSNSTDRDIKSRRRRADALDGRGGGTRRGGDQDLDVLPDDADAADTDSEGDESEYVYVEENVDEEEEKVYNLDLGPQFPDGLSLVDAGGEARYSVDLSQGEIDYDYGSSILPGAKATTGEETYDVHVKLFRTDSCYDQAGSATYAASTADIKTTTFTESDTKQAATGIICYANTMFPNISVAFDFSIVRFSNEADSGMVIADDAQDVEKREKKRVNLRQYTDHCRSPGGLSPIQALADETDCAPFLGTMFARYSLVARRTTGCQAGEACSPLKLARQLFYPTSSCLGNPTVTYKYPIQKECMRYVKGTQNFTTDVAYQNITEKEYEGSNDCTGPTITYQMQMNKCYSLYGNRGFRWETDGNYLASSAFGSPRQLFAAGGGGGGYLGGLLVAALGWLLMWSGMSVMV